MAVVSLREMLEDARRGGYAVPLFDTQNMAMIRSAVQVAEDTEPLMSCDMHKMINYCKDGKHVATTSCPASSVMQVAALDYARETVNDITVADDAFRLPVLSVGNCPVHGGVITLPDQEENVGTESEKHRDTFFR